MGNLRYILIDRYFLILLFFVNFFGTIYGFFWYESQLKITPTIFIPFVPDSPTASMFFTIWLLFFILRKNLAYMSALAVMSLFKYGVWAVVMNVFTLIVDGAIGWQGYMLIASHAGMAIQVLLYTPFYDIKMRHFAVASVWILHNDIIDYVYEMMPIYSSLTDYMNEIGYFTFWLSIITIVLVYFLTLHRKSKHVV